MARKLDPQAQELLDVLRVASFAPLYTLPVEQARERARSALIAKGEPPAVLRVENVAVPTPNGARGLRLYRPAEGFLPAALFIHGGGWTLNDLDTHDRLCRLVARRSGWLLAALDFRRAPEHRHPAALEDAYYAYRWMLDNVDSLGVDADCLAVIGESSGGTTAASLLLLLRDMHGPMPGYQVLVYPAVDLCDRWPSYRERGTGYTLDRDHLVWFFGNYVPSEWSRDDQYLLPMAADDLSGMPPTLVMTAEFDPLRDEGIAYAQKLTRAGVTVEHLHVEDQMHGFLLLDRGLARARELIDTLADALLLHAERTYEGLPRLPRSR
jgi:acetyl esterase/lipase